MRPSEFKAIKALAESIREELNAIKKSIQDQQAAVDNSQETTKKELRKIPWSNIVSVILNTEHERASTQAQRNEENAHQSAVLRWTRYAFFISVLIALIYVATLWEVKTSADAAKTAAEASQYSAEVSDKSLLLAQKSERDSRLIGEKTLVQMKEQMILDQRPWVSLSAPPMRQMF